MENECISHNYSLFAMFLPNIIQIGGNFTKFWQKQICTVIFLRHGVYGSYKILNTVGFLTHCVVHFVATFLSSGSLCRIYEFLFIEGVNLIFSLSLWVTLISLFVRLSRVAMQIAGCLIRTKLLPAVWCRMHTCMCAYEWLHMYSLQCLVYDAI